MINTALLTVLTVDDVETVYQSKEFAMHNDKLFIVHRGDGTEDWTTVYYLTEIKSLKIEGVKVELPTAG